MRCARRCKRVTAEKDAANAANTMAIKLNRVPPAGPPFEDLIDTINLQDLAQNQKENLNGLVLRSIESFKDDKIDFAIKKMK